MTIREFWAADPVGCVLALTLVPLGFYKLLELVMDWLLPIDAE